MVRRSHFEVDKEGLRQLVAKRGKSFVLFELYQNSRDQNVTRIDISFQHVEHQTYRVSVEDDDPEGFKDLSHAYTLFAPSEKKGDPAKSGLFNLGEKLVIAACNEATILTTRGGVRFDNQGRHHLRKGRKMGSSFEGFLTIPKAEYEEACREFLTIVPREGVTVTFNGNVIPHREPITTFDISLPTPLGDAVTGDMKTVVRKTTVGVYTPLAGEIPMLYEHGIPVVENGGKYHYLVHQKVPVPMDRDNVPPSYLRKLHTAVLNELHTDLTAEDATSTWVKSAVENDKVQPDAVRSFVKRKYGEKVVIADPSDREAEKIAVSQGYTVVHGGHEPGEAWRNIKKAEAMLPAGQVTPSPKPYSDDPDATPANLLPEDRITPAMRRVEAYTVALAKKVMGVDLKVWFVEMANASATYRRGSHRSSFEYIVGNLGVRWFERPPACEEITDLILHEFGHQYESDHLSREYYRALTRLGARFTMLALDEPGFFSPYR